MITDKVVIAEDLRKQWVAADLLEPPAPEVVRGLIERVSRAEAALAAVTAERDERRDAFEDLQGRLWCALGQPEGIEFVQAARDTKEALTAAQDEARRLRERYAFAENQRLCVGDAGGCDGNLTAMEHEPNCPARAKDKSDLRPYLYEDAPPTPGAAEKGDGNLGT